VGNDNVVWRFCSLNRYPEPDKLPEADSISKMVEFTTSVEQTYYLIDWFEKVSFGNSYYTKVDIIENNYKYGEAEITINDDILSVKTFLHSLKDGQNRNQTFGCQGHEARVQIQNYLKLFKNAIKASNFSD